MMVHALKISLRLRPKKEAEKPIYESAVEKLRKAYPVKES